MRARVLIIVAGGIAVAVASYAVLSPSGLPQVWKLRDDEKSLTTEVAKARADNSRIADDVRVLQGNDPASKAVLEKHAREELGYVKSDEVALTTRAPPPAATTATTATATTATTTTGPTQ